MSEDKVFNYEKAEKLLDPKRQETVPVDKVFELLQLDGADKVADLGAGNGYLTIPIAKATSDRVTAIDLQSEMLELLEAKAVDEGLTNIDRMQSSLESLNLPDVLISGRSLLLSFMRFLTCINLYLRQTEFLLKMVVYSFLIGRE